MGADSGTVSVPVWCGDFTSPVVRSRCSQGQQGCHGLCVFCPACFVSDILDPLGETVLSSSKAGAARQGAVCGAAMAPSSDPGGRVLCAVRGEKADPTPPRLCPCIRILASQVCAPEEV